MADDLQSQLSSILSDPEQMERLGSLAQSILGQSDKPEMTSSSGGLSDLLSGVMGKKDDSHSQQLLKAMTPYMRPERREKLEKAMRLTRLVGIAGSVMRQAEEQGYGL